MSLQLICRLFESLRRILQKLHLLIVIRDEFCDVQMSEVEVDSLDENDERLCEVDCIQGQDLNLGDFEKIFEDVIQFH